MLNITSNTINDRIDSHNCETLKRVESKKSSRVLTKILLISSGIFLVIMFLPWTQNVRTNGSITTIKPNQKPQFINSAIAGRIEKWYVQEGDYIKKGDTIIKLSEIKESYLDPNLLANTQKQLTLKEEKANSYGNKIKTQENQLKALGELRDLKLSQANIKLEQLALKIENDSTAYLAAKINYETALYQYNRMDSLFKKGLKSLTDLEKRNLKVQETKAYKVAAKNKWLNTKNDIVNTQVEMSNIKMKYQADASKIQSEILSTLGNKLETETAVNKLKNSYANYTIRNDMYYVLAPQDGYVTKTFFSGIGETIKEGSNLVNIMPKSYELAIELYVDPIDLPLMEIGSDVQIQFDGWPAIVFSGWPNASYGTYDGKVYAIDQFISANGKYRILVQQDSTDHRWPKELRFGSGTKNMMMLKNVPVWYELWRKINGFPPEFYKKNNKEILSIK